MKANYFTKVEDKYVFRVSTAFWHLLIGIITVAAIVGMVLLIWSIIPPGKEKVKAASYPTKSAYPPVEQVTIADLKMNEEKNAPPPPVQFAPPPESRTDNEVENDPGKPSYDLVLAELKKIIPKDSWQPGYWSYPKGELAWQMHPSDPNYRIWNPGGENVEQRLEHSYKRIKAINYSAKKAALESYMRIMKLVPPAQSVNVLDFIINNMNSRFSDPRLLDTTFSLVEKNLKIFSKTSDAVQTLIGFALNNPKSGFEFIPFAIQECSKFPDSLRLEFLSTLIDGYYSFFNNSVDVQKEATEQFDKLLPQLPGINPSKALRKYYSVYNQKNQKRNSEIAMINEDYNNQISAILADSTMKAIQAEIIYQADKEIKVKFRNMSLYAIAGGFVAIALLGTILTLLSIQRILRRMESVVESKKLD